MERKKKMQKVKESDYSQFRLLHGIVSLKREGRDSWSQFTFSGDLFSSYLSLSLSLSLAKQLKSIHFLWWHNLWEAKWTMSPKLNLELYWFEILIGRGNQEKYSRLSVFTIKWFSKWGMQENTSLGGVIAAVIARYSIQTWQLLSYLLSK